MLYPLIGNDIESEISYAYLHAVASKTGAACEPAGRHSDNRGIDACLTAWGPFEGGGYLEEVDLKVQLKATIEQPAINNGYISYFLQGVHRYDTLRSEVLGTQRILVVMFLPPNPDEWLAISEDELMMKKCAYWVSLRGAAATSNTRGQTVYLPVSQRFSPESLLDIFRRLSRPENLQYQMPSI